MGLRRDLKPGTNAETLVAMERRSVKQARQVIKGVPKVARYPDPKHGTGLFRGRGAHKSGFYN